ncbi:prospero homeobox protein 1-like [Liolophura sinensis]|uniref:prospero homeobox protein 1-like n=1 Tax=Liolophura sinensis TaxID=3198878 RepID=UPI003159621A
MREEGDRVEVSHCQPAQRDMKLGGSCRAADEGSPVHVQTDNNNKCSIVAGPQTDKLIRERVTSPGVPPKHCDKLRAGLPSETSKLLKDILQQKDKKLRENNNSLKSFMVSRDGQDNSDLIAQLLKNNPGSHSHSSMMEERESLRLGTQVESESDSDRDSYTETCRFNGDEDLGDTMDSEIKDGSCEDKHWSSDNYDLMGQSGKDGDSMEAKRARVENIITSMRPSPSGLGGEVGSQLSPDMRRPKRKQYQPQQHDSKYVPHSSSKYRKQEERDKLKEQLEFVQKTLQQMQKQYVDLFDEEEKEIAQSDVKSSRDSKYFDFLSDKLCNRKEEAVVCKNLNFKPSEVESSAAVKQTARSNFTQDSGQNTKDSGDMLEKDNFTEFASLLKYKIADAVASAIDGVMTKFSHTQVKPKKNEILSPANAEVVEKENKPVHVSPRPTEVLPQLTEDSCPVSNLKEKEQNSNKTPKVSDKSERLEKFDRFDHKSFLDSPIRSFMDLPRGHHHPHLPAYPSMPFYLPTQVHHPNPLVFGVEPEQTEALPLVVNTPKKKRTKVTDTRLSPRAARVLLQESVPVSSHSDMGLGRHSPSSYPHMFPMLPTSVAIPNPGLQHSDFMRFYEEQVFNNHHHEGPQSTTHSPLHADQGSPGASHISASEGAHLSNGKRERDSYSPGDSSYDSFHMTSTLTPMHLRKAKLMFFFVRYPSSAILKMYFPDIKFNKNNTAQLVKWFSNFREFYYIQMEKYSRQALAEGVKNSEDLIVTTDSELYRVLNLHYNRNNQLEVPESFRGVVQSTLREFFKAICSGKDQEQSWKKAIYKVIARMDDALPEYFKSPNWMEQLGEM